MIELIEDNATQAISRASELQKIILLRGLPGAGKKTLASLLQLMEPGMTFHSAEHYWHDRPYDRTLVKAAHNACYEGTKADLLAGKSVVVANPFTRRWEVEKYLLLAAEHDVWAFTMIVEGAFEPAHAVPPEVMQAMKRRWQMLHP